MTNILAVDPGGTVGLAWGPLELFDVDKAEWSHHIRVDQVKREATHVWNDPDVAVVMKVLTRLRQEKCGICVVERWEHRPGSVLRGGDEALSPHAQGAMLIFALSQKWFANFIFFQSASQAKPVITDKRLKAMGLYDMTKGKEHARDALRHYLLFTRRWNNGEVAV